MILPVRSDWHVRSDGIFKKRNVLTKKLNFLYVFKSSWLFSCPVVKILTNFVLILQSYLNKLILDDSQRQIRKVKVENTGKESEEELQNKIMELEVKCVRFSITVFTELNFFRLFENFSLFCRIITLAS